jgi:hypothetical protein
MYSDHFYLPAGPMRRVLKLSIISKIIQLLKRRSQKLLSAICRLSVQDKHIVAAFLVAVEAAILLIIGHKCGDRMILK